MPVGDSKKSTNNGLLCGLRAEPSIDQLAHARTNGDVASGQHATVSGPQRRPQSLTLPFENRDRESHLLTDEELDRIIRQDQLNSPLPRLPTEISRGSLGFGFRRSMSTARNKRLDLGGSKPRPASADLSQLLSTVGDAYSPHKMLSLSQRHPTLTALPDAPTANDLLAYPQSPSRDPVKRSDPVNIDIVDTGTDKFPSPTTAKHLATKPSHKRTFSAAGLLESVKKRMKHEDNVEVVTRERQDSIAISEDTSSKRSGTENQLPTHVHEISKPRQSTEMLGGRASALSNHGTTDLKRSLLQRTWDKTKHAARLSISTKSPSSPRSSTPCDPQRPFSIDGTDDGRTTPTQSIRTHTTSQSSRYYASAEASPVHTSRPDTTMSAMDSSYEFISGPAPRRTVLSKLGVPPSRAQLNTVVSRQQSRIVDLTLQNNVLVNQVELLRGEVQDMKIRTMSPKEKKLHRRSGDFNHVFGAERPVSSSGSAIERSNVVSRMAREESYDPRGWRKIVGVHDADDADTEMCDDRRKTWMTCDDEDKRKTWTEPEDKRQTWMTCDS